MLLPAPHAFTTAVHPLFFLEFFGGQGIRHEPGLGDHLVPDAFAVFIGGAIQCPRQHVADFVLLVGYDLGGEGFPEFQSFGLAVLGVHRGIYDAQAGVELCPRAEHDLTEPGGRRSSGH